MFGGFNILQRLSYTVFFFLLIALQYCVGFCYTTLVTIEILEGFLQTIKDHTVMIQVLYLTSSIMSGV